jgi:hypothetical protein
MQPVKLGSLGEARAITKFLALGYTIFTPFSEGHDQFDFIACKDNTLLRVEVKSTAVMNSNGNYTVAIRGIRHNMNGSRVKLFDPNNCDVLACYIQPLDEVCFLLSKNVHATRCLNFREEYSPHKTMAKSRQRLVRDYTDLESILPGA